MLLQVWARRPLPSTLVQYAANDVRFLLRLYDKLSARLPARAKDRVRDLFDDSALET